MPRPRVVMRKIRDVLRLTLGEGLSQRRVRQITGVPEATNGLDLLAAEHIEDPLRAPRHLRL